MVSRLTQKPELAWKAKPLYDYFHKYESQYGELSQISKLEKRMAELFPDDPKLSQFASRYSGEGFDPTGIRLIVSPATQTRPRGVMQSIEQPPPAMQASPRPQYVQEASRSPRPQYLQPLPATNSPKRPFPTEDLENDLNRPRKLARGESPLKGAAGRRLDQQKRLQQGTPSWNAPPFVVPRDITFLLSIIPRADLYAATKFKPEALVRLLRETIVPDYSTWKTAKEESQAPPQRYGTHPSSSEPPHRPQKQQAQARNGRVEQNGFGNQAYHGNPAFYSGPPGSNVMHGYPPPPPPGFQPPHVADPSSSGFYGDESGSREPVIPPRLWPAASWY